MTTREQHHGALVWVAVGASLWGTDTVLRRPLASHLSSIQIVLMEHLILTALLAPSLWMGRATLKQLRPAQWAAIFGISWGGSALGTICFTEAVRIGNPTTAILLQKVQPLIAALLAWAFLRESLGRQFWIRLALAIGAAYLISFGVHLPEAHAAGAAPWLALAAATLWASSTVLGRFVLETLSFPGLTQLRIVIAAPLLAATTWLRAPLQVTSLDAHQWLLLLLLALIPGLAALLIYYRGLQHTRASLAAVAELCFPASATLLNWAILGVRISPAQVAGVAILWAVILSWERMK
jgi:drug/metabolite transporter (DMT)-like permease